MWNFPACFAAEEQGSGDFRNATHTIVHAPCSSAADYRVDLRESVFNFLPQVSAAHEHAKCWQRQQLSPPRITQEVYTRDTVMLNVNCVMYYSIQVCTRENDLHGVLVAPCPLPHRTCARPFTKWTI